MRMNRFLSTTTVLSALASAGVGCVQSDVDVVGVGAPIALRDGLLAGDFGPRRGIAGSATWLEGRSDGDSTSVHIVREQRGVGTGMVIVSLSGVSFDELTSGAHAFSVDENTLDAQTIFVNVCSGDADVAFDYDVPARGTLVVDRVVVDGVEVVDIDVHAESARSDGGIDVTDASFSYVPVR